MQSKIIKVSAMQLCFNIVLHVHVVNVLEYDSTFYVGMGQVKNGVLYLRYRRNFVIAKAECYKSFTSNNILLF